MNSYELSTDLMDPKLYSAGVFVSSYYFLDMSPSSITIIYRHKFALENDISGSFSDFLLFERLFQFLD